MISPSLLLLIVASKALASSEARLSSRQNIDPAVAEALDALNAVGDAQAVRLSIFFCCPRSFSQLVV